MELVIIIVLGFLLDLLMGDPEWIPHPVVLIGKLISGMEKILRKIFPDTEEGCTIAGVILTLVVTGLGFTVPMFLLIAAGTISPWLVCALEVFWCGQIFAAKSLKQASLRVYEPIVNGDLEGARKYLSWIVGRDTGDLDFRQITKATVETVAENTSDGVIAPMFYMMIGGIPLGFFYKAGNTLDSMVGYKNEKYLYFGRCSAYFDDILNFIPARITGLAMVAAAYLTGLDGKTAWKTFRRDRKNHSSPNAAHPESACAGALNVQLAGDAYYFGELYKKKTIGDDIRPIEPDDILKTNRLMMAASILTLACFAGIRILIVMLILK